MTREKRPPTDFELLRAIYTRHREEYVSTTPPRIFVPVDIPAIALELGVEENSVFGRLYHHLDQVHGERPGEGPGPRRFFFSPKLGTAVNCINFPLMEAVLAGLWQQRSRDALTIDAAFISLAIALASLAVSIFVA